MLFDWKDASPAKRSLRKRATLWIECSFFRVWFVLTSSHCIQIFFAITPRRKINLNRSQLFGFMICTSPPWLCCCGTTQGYLFRSAAHLITSLSHLVLKIHSVKICAFLTSKACVQKQLARKHNHLLITINSLRSPCRVAQLPVLGERGPCEKMEERKYIECLKNHSCQDLIDSM